MTPPLHAALVVHSLNDNNIGRVYPFLRALVGVPGVRLTLVGWDRRGTLSPLLGDLPWPVVGLRGPLAGTQAARALAHATHGCNLIHCFKSQDHLEAAAHVARAQGVPLVLDLDDWELGLYLEGVGRWPAWRRALSGWPITRRVARLMELERLARRAPAALLVNSTALQAYFGGQIAYTAADPALLDPRLADGPAFRAAHGLPPDAPLIGFLGTPHPHKGIDDLLEAFVAVRRVYPKARLLFVGVAPHNLYHRRLLQTPGVVMLGYLEAAGYGPAYAACDLIAIPQRAVAEGIVQTPAKLILAMAAGRPIVATRIGDMPTILGNAGLLVAPEDPRALGAALIALLGAPAARATLGAAARTRFLEGFTLEHLRAQVLAVYAAVTGRGSKLVGDDKQG